MKTNPLFVTGLAVLAMAVPTSAANLLVNGGFEDPVTMDGPPFIGLWEAFNGGAGATSANSDVMPRSGALSLRLEIAGVDNTFAGAFQDVVVSAGTEYIFGGWNASPSSPLDLTAEFRIEWRNAGSNTEISRTPNSTPTPSAEYSPFSLTATAPVGADLARVVYAIQTFSPEPSNNGIVFVDDVSFAIVPEPSSLAFLIAGGLALVGMRRRI